jgi:hypothetical protein
MKMKMAALINNCLVCYPNYVNFHLTTILNSFTLFFLCTLITEMMILRAQQLREREISYKKSAGQAVVTYSMRSRHIHAIL